MKSFVGTDDCGNFILDGKPWPVHGATYFGRRPGTCGADWMTEHFEHNFAFLARDLDKMNDLGLNTLALFVPARLFFKEMQPVEMLFDRLEQVLDKVKTAGLRVILCGWGSFAKETWCRAQGVEPPEGLWHPAAEPLALEAQTAWGKAFRGRFADRPEIIGWPGGGGRFFRYAFDIAPVRPQWAQWLKRRFNGDFALVKELFDLPPEEDGWEKILMPQEMEPYFNQHNPRAFEFAVMQQVLVSGAAARLHEALKPVTPGHILFRIAEGCSFSVGLLTNLIPELVRADAIYVECYNWEGLRSYPVQTEAERKWMEEPAANKPAVKIINNAGYEQMLTRWIRRSGKPAVMCHGADIGEYRRGVPTDEDHARLLDRFNTYLWHSGAHGLSYWCWSDDEQSKTCTRAKGVEYTLDTKPEDRPYWQSGETMGLLNFGESERPACKAVRRWSEKIKGRASEQPPEEVLVLFPCPVFQSLYRYRANLTGFALLTSLARQGIFADVAMTSYGETIIKPEELSPYRLIILGVGEYLRDHPEVPDLLVRYVEAGGTLFLPVGRAGELQDPYLKWRANPALARLTAAKKSGRRVDCLKLSSIKGEHPSFKPKTENWSLPEAGIISGLTLDEKAEVLARAGGIPLLCQHNLGKGRVYVFTWNLDVFLYQGETIDYPGADWDWLWSGLAKDLNLTQNSGHPFTAIIRETMAENTAG